MERSGAPVRPAALLFGRSCQNAPAPVPPQVSLFSHSSVSPNQLTVSCGCVIINKPPEKGDSERGDPWRLALPTKEEVIHMGNGLILFLLEMIQKGAIISVTVSKGTVTIRIKK